MGEVNKLTSIQEILHKIEKANKWEQLYVSANIYGYKKDGRWYEVDRDGTVREV